jgi:hypothetical protein
MHDKLLGFIVYMDERGQRVPLFLYQSKEDDSPYFIYRNKNCVHPYELQSFIQAVEEAVSKFSPAPPTATHHDNPRRRTRQPKSTHYRRCLSQSPMAQNTVS